MQPKSKLNSQTIRGFLMLLVPAIIGILRLLGVDVTEELGNQFVENVIKILEGALWLKGLWDVYTGRHKATQPLSGWLK